jgi:hypothetical protein
LGNTKEWSNAGIWVSYYNAVFDPITGWSAVYNPEADTIVISWTNPGKHPERLDWSMTNSLSDPCRKSFIPYFGHQIRRVPAALAFQGLAVILRL